MRQVLNSVFKDRQVCWYKPVCLLAVLYEIKKGMSPRNIEPAAVMKRLLILEKHVFPDGKWQGHKAWKTNPSAEKWTWQPLCRLTNDGALQFLDQEGQRVDSSIGGRMTFHLRLQS
jgi:hypothetical protein